LFYPGEEIVCKRMNFDEGWSDPFVTHVLQIADKGSGFLKFNTRFEQLFECYPNEPSHRHCVS
jgi:hypothetical protein